MQFFVLLRRTSALAIAVILFAATPVQVNAFDDGERKQIETIIRDYLLANPEIMVEVQQALEARQEVEREAAVAAALTSMETEIYTSPNQIEIGPEDASITVVEFFDYNCGFCRRAMDDMTKFLETDPDIRFVLKEFPVLGEASLEAHRISLAVNTLKPEIAAEFHVALMEHEGRKDGPVAANLAIAMGVDEAALTAEIEKPYIVEAIRETYNIADALGITGTPSYVIGDEVVFGAVGFDRLAERVAAVRECGKATC